MSNTGKAITTPLVCCVSFRCKMRQVELILIFEKVILVECSNALHSGATARRRLARNMPPRSRSAAAADS